MHDEAAPVTYGALTSLTFLRDRMKLRRGQKIMILGASGGVGSYAVQIAKYYGAVVTGVCSTKHLELVKRLGADKVIDYTSERRLLDPTEKYDFVFDAGGKSTFKQSRKYLLPKGAYYTTMPDLNILYQMLWTYFFSKRKAKFVASSFYWLQKDLTFINELIEARELKSIIAKKYLLKDMGLAHEYLEKGGKKGNVVVNVYLPLDIMEEA
jgi:NADPH:quinone reductase-like Zn-dependent oxidoreductase